MNLLSRKSSRDNLVERSIERQTRLFALRRTMPAECSRRSSADEHRPLKFRGNVESIREISFYRDIRFVLQLCWNKTNGRVDTIEHKRAEQIERTREIDLRHVHRFPSTDYFRFRCDQCADHSATFFRFQLFE
jgi:hypothetical protein